MLAARALVRGLAELGFDDLRLVLARESERFLEFALECAPGDAEAVVRSRYDLGRRLACAVDGEVASSTQIRLKLSRFQRLAGLLGDEGTVEEPLLLVPVGAAENGVYYLNLAAAGNAIVVGSRHEAWKLLSAWLASVAAVYPPEHLAFLPAGGAASHLGDAASLPHFVMAAGEAGERSVEELATELEETIVAREAASPATGPRAPIVGLAALSGECRAEIERLETVLRRGPERGISTVCVAEEENEAQLLGVFGARLVFGALAEGSTTFGAGQGELALSVGREPPLILKAVEVRTEVLRPRTGAEPQPSSEELPPVRQEERPAATVDREEAPPQPEGLTPEDIIEAPQDQPEEPSLDVDSEGQPAVEDEKTAQEPDGRASRQEMLLLAEEDAPSEEGTDAGPPVFGVRCFGSFEVRANGREISGWTVQKARELLAYLIARGGTAVLRDEVAEALWPDGEPAQVQHNLSNAAYYLRRAMKGALSGTDVQVFAASGQRYHLRSGMFRVDVDAFDAHLRRAEALEGTEALVEYERALELYRGDLLGNEPYEWADAYRREYQRRFLAAAHRAAGVALDCRDTGKAMEFYQTILARDPIDEEAAQGLMRCYGKLGDQNGARKVYKVLGESLRRELEDDKAQPLPETTAVFQELATQGRGR